MSDRDDAGVLQCPRCESENVRAVTHGEHTSHCGDCGLFFGEVEADV